jgi:Glycosyl hydrolases family 8
MTERATPRRSPASTPLLVALLAAIPLSAFVYALVTDDSDNPVGVDDGPVPATREAAADFLDRYVDEGGRVVRHDQGGDTVSEGQSYALLLAQVAGDRETFARVWEWTRSNLLAGAAGRPRVRDRLIDEAARLDAAHPTYYGAAWVALGRALLTTDLLGGCGARARAG